MLKTLRQGYDRGSRIAHSVPWLASVQRLQRLGNCCRMMREVINDGGAVNLRLHLCRCFTLLKVFMEAIFSEEFRIPKGEPRCAAFITLYSPSEN
jgi:hypothetical protein